MAGPHTLEFTDANFETEVLNSSAPVLVDFWAEWCGPCRALGPVIDELATEYAGKVKVGKVDTDANRAVSMRYQISAIPTVLLLNQGQLVERFVGLRSKKDLKAAVDGVLSPK
ncbi:MAG TPA: thioredoxin [Phycisphaerae bacterium]|nr:thioredoxin [Phycisphaerae bacterium]HNU44398.1 thioredoxin [Phycisphaerae bacterium]